MEKVPHPFVAHGDTTQLHCLEFVYQKLQKKFAETNLLDTAGNLSRTFPKLPKHVGKW